MPGCIASAVLSPCSRWISLSYCSSTFVILYFVTVQVCSPAFSLLVHDIMIPCLDAAGVRYTKLCTHPSIRFLPSVLLHHDWSTLTSYDRSDSDEKMNLLSLEWSEFPCALLDTV